MTRYIGETPSEVASRRLTRIKRMIDYREDRLEKEIETLSDKQKYHIKAEISALDWAMSHVKAHLTQIGVSYIIKDIYDKNGNPKERQND